MNGGEKMELIVGIVVLIAAHTYLEKRGLPPKMEQMKLRYFLVIAIIGISTVIILSGLFAGLHQLVGIVTILFATSIAYKYRKKFEKMERGEEV
ncbi:hypothetical protein RV17_GL002388 [Enterococcus thailandicus]|nr:hypothetical protein RV17_GL002388 [Enterococcus thailandicus]